MSDVEVLTARELQRFCDFLYRRTGMIFGEAKRYYVDRRVADRMKATGDAGFAGYFDRLRRDGAELEQLINAFTVNETYFYREAHQFACMTRDLLPLLVQGREPGALLRILSAPCSTGEEAYSIAIWLLETWPLVDAYNVEISGVDIDTAALAQASEGWYGPKALARLPADLLAAYFEPGEGERRRLIGDIRQSVGFAPANLVDASTLRPLGRYDIVFCRNMLIYFDDAARRTAAEHLFDLLRPGGFLALGHSESMTAIDDRFLARRFGDAVVYQRPERS